jgi:hypothetical protein
MEVPFDLLLISLSIVIRGTARCRSTAASTAKSKQPRTQASQDHAAN